MEDGKKNNDSDYRSVFGIQEAVNNQTMAQGGQTLCQADGAQMATSTEATLRGDWKQENTTMMGNSNHSQIDTNNLGRMGFS